MTMYLKSLKSGAILPYNERIIRAGGVIPVTEREAFPERFAPVALEERSPQVDISVPEEVAVAPPFVPPELLADGQKGFDQAATLQGDF
jgi:hypothetical protein